MSPELFEHFLRLVISIVKKEDNKFQQLIPTEEFLDGKFRVLASGNTSGLLHSVTESRNLKSYFKRNLQFNFFFVIRCLRVVTAKKEWKKMLTDINETWNLTPAARIIDGKNMGVQCPKVMDALFYIRKRFSRIIDGKNMGVQCPRVMDSLFYIHKRFFSLVLLPIVPLYLM